MFVISMNISTSKSETAPGHGFPAWGISPASVISCHPLAALGVPVHLYSLPRVSPLCGSTLGYQLPPLSGLMFWAVSDLLMLVCIMVQ